MATPNLQVNERMALEERIAILKAIKCPGKTHSTIKNPTLRAEFARELNDWRNQRNRAKREGNPYLSQEQWMMWRGGLESGFWALQKAENRAFIYEDRRVAWQLRTVKSYQTEQYKKYEVAVIDAHKNTVELLARIEQDWKVGKIDEHKRIHFRRLALEREEAKINELQAQYEI